jgi:hypothetical protein
MMLIIFGVIHSGQDHLYKFPTVAAASLPRQSKRGRDAAPEYAAGMARQGCRGYELERTFLDSPPATRYSPPATRYSLRASGSVKVKVLPWPGPALAAVSSPPMAQVRWRAMVRPMPEPPLTRAREGSWR